MSYLYAISFHDKQRSFNNALETPLRFSNAH